MTGRVALLNGWALTLKGGCNPGAAQTGDRVADTGSFCRSRPYQPYRVGFWACILARLSFGA
jgi:hypothetical protein